MGSRFDILPLRGRSAIALFALFPGCQTPGPTETPPPEEISPAAELAAVPESPAVAVASDGPSGLAAMTLQAAAEAQVTSRDPLSFLPSGARWVAQVRPQVLYEVDDFGLAVDFLAARIDPNGAAALVSMRGCGLDPAKIESLSLAHEGTDGTALVVRGAGFGDPDKWRCVRTKLVADGHTPAFAIEVVGGQTVARRGKDGGRFVDVDTFVLFDEIWENAVSARIDGTAPSSAMDGALASVIGRVATSEPAWFAMLLTPAQQESLVGTSVAAAQEIWGALSVGEALAMTVATRASSTEAAKTMRLDTQAQWNEFKVMVPMLGLPSTLESNVSFTALGDLASMHITATPDEVRAIGRAIAGKF